MPPTKIVRSLAEIRFAAQAEPCPGCGVHALGVVELVGAGDCWSMAADCPSCGLGRSWQFETRGSPAGVSHDRFELGAGPSELLSPEVLLKELERVTPLIAEDPRPSSRSDDDPVERAEYEREIEHRDRTSGIRPSKLVR